MEERAVAAAVGGVKELQQRSLISWIIDSGCSTHMVSSEELLFDIKWESKRVIVPGGRTLNAVGIGRIKGLLEATDEEGGGKNIEVSFNDVLLVPNLGRNLLSVAKIVDRGGEVTFNSHGAFVGVKGMRLPLKKASGSSRELLRAGVSFE